MANTRIVRLQAENVKKLSAVEIVPDPKGNLVIIGGKNAQGKSSVLDAIMYALGGKKVLPSEPVRRGADKAEIIVELEELVVTRVMTEKTDRLTVSSKDGAKFSSPQTILDKLFGSLSFDPLAFARMGETPQGRREQAEVLRKMLGLDFSEIDRKRQSVFDERTIINRDLTGVKAQLAAIPKHEAPEQEISVSALAEELQEAMRGNQRIEDARKAVKDLAAEILLLQENIKDYEQAIQILRNKLKVAQEEYNLREPALKQLSLINTSVIQTRIAEAETVNRKIRDNGVRKTLADKVSGLERQSETLTKELAALDNQKVKKLAAVKMPIEGLSVDSNGVWFNGLPLEQASSSEQLRISVAIGLAQKPELRVMLCKQGNDLDEDSLKLLRSIAQETDSQIWLERIAGGESAVIIENGEVKE